MRHSINKKIVKWRVFFAAFVCWFFYVPAVFPAVQDARVSDVSTRSFAISWVVSAPVVDAQVSVFADADGQIDVSDDVEFQLVSSNIPGAHDIGVGQIVVTNLSPLTEYFVRLSVTDNDGTSEFPEGGELLNVITQQSSSRVTNSNGIIVNDLLEIINESPVGQVSPLAGGLTFVEAPGVSDYPLSAFSGSNGLSFYALNNFFDDTGQAVGLDAGEVLQQTAWRGLSCVELSDQAQVSFSKVSSVSSAPAVSALVATDSCFFADIVCDDLVDILDIQFLLNGFGAVSGSCAFNPAHDLVADSEINILDLQSLLNQFGEQAPFE